MRRLNRAAGWVTAWGAVIYAAAGWTIVFTGALWLAVAIPLLVTAGWMIRATTAESDLQCLAARAEPCVDVACPECGEPIPVYVRVHLRPDGEDGGQSIVAEPDITDVYAHAWARHPEEDQP